MRHQIILASIFSLVLSSQAMAGTTTISIFDSGLITHLYQVITNAGSSFIAEFGLCDGVAAAQCAAVKAASTAAVASDPALVVTLSPNNNAITTPKTGAFTFPGCSVTTSSAQCLAGALATNHVQIQNTSVSASIACNWGGTAVLNSIGSVQLAAGQSSLWGPATAGVPTQALNCIGSGAATLYIEYN